MSNKSNVNKLKRLNNRRNERRKIRNGKRSNGQVERRKRSIYHKPKRKASLLFYIILAFVLYQFFYVPA